MPYVNYADLTPEQQEWVRRVNTNLKEGHHADRMFWICSDGSVSRRNGHWQYTKAASDRVSAEIKAAREHNVVAVPREKGGIKGVWKPGAEFHLDGGKSR